MDGGHTIRDRLKVKDAQMKSQHESRIGKCHLGTETGIKCSKE